MKSVIIKKLCLSLLMLFTTHSLHANKTPHSFKAPSTPSNTSAAWAMWCHANGDNSLADFIDYNTSNMASAKLTDQTLILVQADRPNDVGTYRYRVEKNKVSLIEHLSYEMGQRPGQEIIDGISWFKNKYAFNNLILNLWGHGSGIMDPVRRLKHHRGILFDDTNNTYLDNQNLSMVMDNIASSLGKSIDIFGTDACLMGGIEVGWQIKNSVKILVASETTEPGSGWDYAPFLNAIAQKPTMTAEDVAKEIVKAYGAFYKKDTSPYTLSAMNLNKLPAVVQGLHSIIDNIKICMQKDARNTLIAIMSARALSLQMDENSYIDLISFLTALNKQLSRMKIRSFDEHHAHGNIDAQNLDLIQDLDIIVEDTRMVISDVISYFTDPQETRAFKDDVNKLVRAIDATIKAASQAIIANTAGNGMNQAKGMTIYFPPARTPIHPSYPKTKFAKETRWMQEFLIGILGYQKS
jgi:hypothetical protein